MTKLVQSLWILQETLNKPVVQVPSGGIFNPHVWSLHLPSKSEGVCIRGYQMSFLLGSFIK